MLGRPALGEGLWEADVRWGVTLSTQGDVRFEATPHFKRCLEARRDIERQPPRSPLFHPTPKETAPSFSFLGIDSPTLTPAAKRLTEEIPDSPE